MPPMADGHRSVCVALAWIYHSSSYKDTNITCELQRGVCAVSGCLQRSALLVIDVEFCRSKFNTTI